MCHSWSRTRSLSGHTHTETDNDTQSARQTYWQLGRQATSKITQIINKIKHKSTQRRAASASTATATQVAVAAAVAVAVTVNANSHWVGQVFVLVDRRRVKASWGESRQVRQYLWVRPSWGRINYKPMSAHSSFCVSVCVWLVLLYVYIGKLLARIFNLC